MRAAAQIESGVLSLAGLDLSCEECGHGMEATVWADSETVRLAFYCPLGACDSDKEIEVPNQADLLDMMEPPAPEEDLYAESAWPTRPEDQQ